MPNPTDPRPGRLIIPGADTEPEAEAGGAPKIIAPSGGAHHDVHEDEPAAAEPPRREPASRIIAPPGVAREIPEDLPEYPRLRPLVLMPFSDGQRELILVNDPMGVIPGQAVLSMDSLPLLQLLDGTVSINDVSAALMRESKDLRVANMVRDFVAQLDELLMLESPRYHKALQALREAYHPLEIRPAALEGRSYPAERAALRHVLESHFAEAEKRRATAQQPVAPPDARPRALLAPHLDPRRAGPAIARTYLELGPEQKEPLRVVVFGTGHALYGDLLALTRKHFETPLGMLHCDTAFVDRVAGRLGEDTAYRSELAHRDEHSIEFQALYLKQRFGDRAVTIVPILCGGFYALLDEQKTPREVPELEVLIEAVRDAERSLGGATVYLAGVDFSHVGPRFGGPPVDDRLKQEVESRDRAAITAAEHGDPDAWFRAIAEHEDSTRICGFAPVYLMLRCAGVSGGRLLEYEQSAEPDGSVVSIASMVWG
jgi:AmmeMemoRadiSam system protein B